MRLFGRKTKTAVAQIALKNASFIYGLGGARWLERRFDLLATEGYENNPIVYACVTKLAKSAASVDLQLYKKGKGGRLTKVDAHPILDLLTRPNAMQGGKKFIETLITQYLVGGNGYILASALDRKTGQPGELWLLPPQEMSVNGTKRSMIPASYERRIGNEQNIIYPVNPITGHSAVLHLKTVNLLNPMLGLPPLVAAVYGVDVFNSGMAWNKALLDNSASPSGALMVKAADGKNAELSDDQYSRIKAQLDEKMSGARNAGKPLLLEGGLEWVSMSFNPKDMDHRENMLTMARFIAGVYGTPPQLVNIPGESTYSNYSEAKLAYWSDTVLTLLGSILEDLGNWLTPLYGDDLFLWYDEEMLPALEPRRKEKGDRINAAGYMTINEKREAMGLEALPDGGDTVLVQSTLVPLELAGAMTLPEPGSPADNGGNDVAV
ncbi:phage portal protein [Zavarzinella formosa]|uniref:phage portal protein n=1 Tax=Zavarzinella formosa TaxID=360055 RepID=UPI0002F52EB8|nr:phage portal protein [Zavarzinella formosa]